MRRVRSGLATSALRGYATPELGRRLIEVDIAQDLAFVFRVLDGLVDERQIPRRADRSNRPAVCAGDGSRAWTGRHGRTAAARMARDARQALADTHRRRRARFITPPASDRRAVSARGSVGSNSHRSGPHPYEVVDSTRQNHQPISSIERQFRDLLGTPCVMSERSSTDDGDIPLPACRLQPAYSQRTIGTQFERLLIGVGGLRFSSGREQVIP